MTPPNRDETSSRMPLDVAAVGALATSQGAGERGVGAAGADDQIVIAARGVSKRFRIYPSPWGRLMEWATGGRAVRHDNFWALRGVSFEVARGECVGVIGANGSGKSTLLKVLTDVLTPTEGAAETRGRVLSLLELGTGLNPNLTGRQNIIQSAQLLAFPPGYAEEKMGRIEEFAELGEFFDRPIRLYSSGMLVRLSFAMYASFDPDVLIVDEALSVGDVHFQQKCVEWMERMRADGLTLLFVSHDMPAVQRLCDRALLLSHGEVAYHGPSEEAVSRYYGLMGVRREARGVGTGGGGDAREAAPAEPAVEELIAHDVLPGARSRHGSGDLAIEAASFQTDSGAYGMTVEMRRSATIRLLLKANAAIERPQCGIHVYDRLANLVFAAGSRQRGLEIPRMEAGERVVATMRIGMCVQPGEYTFTLGCGEPSPEGPDAGIVHDRHEGLGPITVVYRGPNPRPFYGLADLPFEVTL